MMKSLNSDNSVSVDAALLQWASAWLKPFSKNIQLMILTALLCMGLVSPSFAHQQKTALTRIIFNSNSGNIEIMHRFYMHDAEHAAGVIFGVRPSLLESASSRQLFSSYVVNNFAMKSTTSAGVASELKLIHLGEEIDGQFLWVYQEVSLQEDIQSLDIINLALRDVWPEQSNMVNIDKLGKIYTLTFNQGSDILRVDFQ